MENVLTFIAQGKPRNYPGKTTILEALSCGEEVPVTFYNDDKQIIIINQHGEVSGCIPPNPAMTNEYLLLRSAIHNDKDLTGKAIFRHVYTYDVQVNVIA